MLYRIKKYFAHYGTQVIIILFLVVAGAISFLAQFWLKKENLNITDKTRNIYAILVGVGTGFLGYFANFLISRQKDVNMSTSEILDKVSKNLAVNPMHRRKLVEVAKESLDAWRQLLAVPDAGRKLSDEFFMDNKTSKRKFVRINLDSTVLETRCPSTGTEPILFFNTYEISDGVLSIDSRTEIATFLNQQIEQLNLKVPQSGALFKILSHDKLEKNIRIWVKVPNYTISNTNQIDDVLNTISGVFKNIFIEFQLTVELYVASDINREKVEVAIDSTDKIILEENQLKAYLYTVNRNIFFESLAHQSVYGKPELPVLQIPSLLMQSRLDQIRRGAGDKWNSIVISGNPGAGKTEIVHLFIQEYAPKASDYFIYCNRTEIYQVLENPNSYQSQPIFLSYMADFMTSQNDDIDYLDNANLMMENQPSPYKDALLNRLNKGFNKIVLIVDDLESNSELKDILTRKHDLLISWEIKLILISRSEMPTVNASCKIKLPLWTQQEAILILSEWNSGIDINDISLQRYISENENSSYLLRIIARRNEPNKSVDSMLKEELEDILEPLKRFYTTIRSSPEALLIELRNRILRETAHSELLDLIASQASVDIIDLISKIAWYTKFNINIIGNEEGEKKYKSGLIKPSVITNFASLTDDQAGAFIEICIRLKIMSGTKEAAIWVDHLIPDGSIALRLKKDIVGNINRSIQEQLVRTLDKSQSLSFLIALFDIPLFDALLESNSTFSLRKLLTAQVSRYLTQYTETFNSIASSIFNFTENLSKSQHEQWLPIIGALYPNSPYIQQRCHESVTLNHYRGYYLSILFDQLKLDDMFQQYYNIVGSAELALMALKYGKPEDWVGIVNLLLHEYNSYSGSLLDEWKIFISRIEPSTLPHLVEMILERLIPDGNPSVEFSEIGAKLIEEIFLALSEVYRKKPNLYITLSNPIIKVVANKVRSLIKLDPNYKEEFNIMVKWLAFHHNRELTILSAKYQLKKIGKEYFAIPDNCQSIRNNIAAIRDNIYEGFPFFKLPTTTELLPMIPFANELVADGFPYDYDYSQTYKLARHAWKKTTNNGTIQPLTEAERNNTYVLNWRAIFKL
jgi:hypothetical protein